MGKTRDLFKRIRDTKETFHAKMGTIKDRNGLDLAESEDVKKRWQKYREELYKNDLHDPDAGDESIYKKHSVSLSFRHRHRLCIFWWHFWGCWGWFGSSLIAQLVKNLPAMQEMPV